MFVAMFMIITLLSTPIIAVALLWYFKVNLIKSIFIMLTVITLWAMALILLND